MKQETKKPLYKVLNEQKTQGFCNVILNTLDNRPIRVDCGDKTFAKFDYGYPVSVPSKKEAEANAQYTALAVNNLHILAEALVDNINAIQTVMGILKDWDNATGQAKYRNILTYWDIPNQKAREALNRIS